MVLSWDRVAELAVKTLSANELASSIVYLEQNVLPTGSTTQVDNKDVALTSPTVVAFVDLEPGVNWGHRCRYLVINAETGEVQTYNGQFPPFLTTVSPNLRVVWQGDKVPTWTVVQPEKGDSNERFK